MFDWLKKLWNWLFGPKEAPKAEEVKVEEPKVCKLADKCPDKAEPTSTLTSSIRTEPRRVSGTFQSSPKRDTARRVDDTPTVVNHNWQPRGRIFSLH